MRSVATAMLAVVMVWGVNGIAQQGDADVKQLVQQYQSAWNKGDAKALAALYSQNAMRMQAEGAPLVGRAAIEKLFIDNFAGVWKGTKLSLTTGRTQNVTADVRLLEGTYEVTGGSGGPQRGRFVNTLVREGGQWRLAAVVPVPDTTPGKQ